MRFSLGTSSRAKPAMAAQLVAGGVAETLAAWCVTWRHLASLESTVAWVLLEDHE